LDVTKVLSWRDRGSIADRSRHYFSLPESSNNFLAFVSSRKFILDVGRCWPIGTAYFRRSESLSLFLVFNFFFYYAIL